MQKSKILAFLLALVVSIVLWFYAVTVVNPDDTITISGISVQFEGTEALTSQGLMLTGGDSTKVSIKVSGRRSDLKELNNETVTAIADVTRIAASGSYQLSWSVVWPSTVATGDISETSRAPSRISVTVSDIKENPEVPIELEYTGEPKTGYMIDKSNLTLGTQSISVRGPAEEVNKIARAVVRVDVTDADALIDTDCPVVLLDKDGNELSLSQYVTSSADSVRVTIPILQYKDIKLNATLISGGGATSEDAEVTIEPSTLRVTGNTAVLDAMADELTIRTIDLAQITGTETFEVTPELPSGRYEPRRQPDREDHGHAQGPRNEGIHRSHGEHPPQGGADRHDVCRPECQDHRPRPRERHEYAPHGGPDRYGRLQPPL